MDKLDNVADILSVSAQRFGEMVSRCWASRQDEIGEANLTLHLGVELLTQHDRHVFLHPQFARRQRSEHIDLVAWDFEAGWQLLVESKFLWGADKARPLLKDISRLKQLHVRSFAQNPSVKLSRYGAVLCATCGEDIASWWKDPTKKGKMRSAVWDQLGRQISRMRRECHTFKCEDSRGAWQVHVLWALFQLSEKR